MLDPEHWVTDMDRLGEKKILIVDDDANIRGMVAEYLQGAGYGVVTSPDGWSCLRDIVEASPDAIVLDLEMPKMDGLKAMDLMREADLTQSIPILVASAKGDRDTVLKTAQLGADDFIVKPYSFSELKDRLDKLIVPISYEQVGDLLRSLGGALQPLSSWPKLEESGRADWQIFPLVYRGREICIALAPGITPLAAQHFDPGLMDKNVAVYVKGQHHWRLLYPRAFPAKSGSACQ